MEMMHKRIRSFKGHFNLQRAAEHTTRKSRVGKERRERRKEETRQTEQIVAHNYWFVCYNV